MTKDYEVESIKAQVTKEWSSTLNEWATYLIAKLDRCDKRLTGILCDHDRRIGRLERADTPTNASQPLGATQTPDQGVGIGSGEKVAQDGDTEAREAKEGVGQRAADAQRAAWLASQQEPPPSARFRGYFFPAAFPAPEGLRAERIPRYYVSMDPAFEPEFTAAAYPFVFCDPHDYCGPRPCPSCSPAPPPSAAPVEETSSGGERSTARGAGSCCEPMKNWTSIWGPMEVAGSDVEGIGPPRFCLWCASPLREDGELRVGKGGEG